MHHVSGVRQIAKSPIDDYELRHTTPQITDLTVDAPFHEIDSVNIIETGYPLYCQSKTHY